MHEYTKAFEGPYVKYLCQIDNGDLAQLKTACAEELSQKCFTSLYLLRAPYLRR